ncbi:hypothetical protein NQ314_009041 [Rhamnusium bicolor]|uniref:Intraflagellar transport protein 46 homolog n=1 Tax=Rhamnusium bicolor TaxID=1586634 RepID=A0AAV8Y4V4_9CUCU|nr:hypothetical protein NQ314_009041 [Rhamnusium bicolor]
MQKSFSIVDEDDDVFISDDNTKEEINNPYKIDLSESESEENSNSPKRMNPKLSEFLKVGEATFPQAPNRELISKIPSAGPSGRQTVLKKKLTSNEKLGQMSSESEDSDNEQEKGKFIVPGEYDPKMYENLDVDDDAKEIFQYILKYIPQQLNLDYKFKPFVPEFLPAVGDIDAFLKVIPPETTVTGEHFDGKFLELGLKVLDEPASNQSDPALLHLQLRAASVNPTKKNDTNVVVKKVENIEKNAKIIDKWIKDISDLHKSKLSPVVRYSEAMPDLDDLMQEWPEEMENKLKENGFPQPEDMSVEEYVDTICNIFQIPVVKNKIQSLHLLFCLYAAIKQTQLYQASTINNVNEKQNKHSVKEGADQLVLD